MKTILFLLICFSTLLLKSQSWQEIPISTEHNLNDVFFLNEDYGWIVGDSGTIFRYNSNDWVSVESDFSNKNFTSVFFTDSIHGWITGENGSIFYYSNETISAVSSPTEENLDDIYMLDSTSGWIIGENGTILEFEDNEWNSYPTDSFSSYVEDLNNIQFLDPTYGIITGDWNRILIYEDSSWNEVEVHVGMMQDYTGLYILDKENIFWYHCDNFGGGGHIPGGAFELHNILIDQTTKIGSFGYGRDVQISILNKNSGWAIKGYGILKYDGNSFTNFQYEDLDKVLNSICFINDSTGWIVGDDACLLKYNHLATSVNGNIEWQELQVYPNPFHDHIYIESDSPSINISVMDLQGRILRTYNSNTNKTRMDMNFLNSGIYLLKVSGKNSDHVNIIVKEY